MGLSIWVEALIVDRVAEGDMTHNVSGMWREAGIYEALYESEGKRVKEILPALKIGLGDMLNRPEAYKKYEPSNGWGTYRDAVRFLVDIIQNFGEYPEGVIKVSR